MSDKRFSLISVEYGIFEDNETGKGFDIYKCVDTLNELANENEELKKLIRIADGLICWNTIPQVRRQWETQKKEIE